jgi:hypothetical protein
VGNPAANLHSHMVGAALGSSAVGTGEQSCRAGGLPWGFERWIEPVRRGFNSLCPVLVPSQ